LPLATVLCVAVPSPSAQPVALATVLPLLAVLCIVVHLTDAVLGVLSKNWGGVLPSATALCVAAPEPSVQPVALATVLHLLAVLRVRLAPRVDAALGVLSKNWGGVLPSATALCVAAPSPSAQPVALAPVLPLLTVLLDNIASAALTVQQHTAQFPFWHLTPQMLACVTGCLHLEKGAFPWAMSNLVAAALLVIEGCTVDLGGIVIEYWNYVMIRERGDVLRG